MAFVIGSQMAMNPSQDMAIDETVLVFKVFFKVQQQQQHQETTCVSTFHSENIHVYDSVFTVKSFVYAS